jgi:hypothetical protein
MQPSLAYVDRHTGRLLEQHFLPAEFHQQHPPSRCQRRR